MRKPVLVAACVGLLVLISTIAVIRHRTGKIEAAFLKAQQAKSIAELEASLGPPYQVYTNFPPPLGKSIISEAEFSQGAEIRVYTLQQMPPVFLVAKVNVRFGVVLKLVVERS